MSPPLSSADRKKKFVEKLKLTGNYNAFKQKRAEYEKARRQRLKESLAELSDSKRMEALRHGRLMSLARVQKYRERKKQNSDPLDRKSFDAPLITNQPDPSSCNSNREHYNSMSPVDQTAPSSAKIPEIYTPKSSTTKLNFEHSYNTNSALHKAVTKARNALPTSPSKRKAVLAKLIYGLDDKSQKEIFRNQPTMKRTGHKRIAPTMIQEIHKFYERDDISRMSTNVGDLTTFVDPISGAEMLLQLRYLIYTLKQAYDLFMKENAEATVKLSKFCSLRPAHVKLCNKDLLCHKDFDVTSMLQVDLEENAPSDSQDEDESTEWNKTQLKETKPIFKKLIEKSC